MLPASGRLQSIHPVVLSCLFALSLASLSGCASAPYRAHPELPRRSESIRTAGLLPPSIALFEEQSGFKLVPNDAWSLAANEAIRLAFRDELAVMGRPLVLLGEDDPELADVSDLFGAVDVAITSYDFQQGSGNKHDEPFPGREQSFDYTLGPVKEVLERHGVDAVWCVTGFNLLPTPWAKAGDAANILISLVVAIGGSPVMLPTVLLKYEIRAALVDKDGQVLFFTRIDAVNASRFPGAPPEPPAPWAGPGELAEQPVEPIEPDLRDANTARRLVRGLMAEFDKASGR